MTQCTALFVGKPGFFDDAAECIAHYVKLNNSQKRFRKVGRDEVPPSADAARLFIILIHEKVDRQCLSPPETLSEKFVQDDYLEETTQGVRYTVHGTNLRLMGVKTVLVTQEFDNKNVG